MELQGHIWDFNDAGEMLLVDKPLDWSSFDVVKKIRVLFGARRVGHAGTLDPKATGLLIVCTGKKTKTLDSFQGEHKEYIGSCELGKRTPSFDSETQATEVREYNHVTRELLESTLRKYVGVTTQTPPMFSAAKFEGRPLYAYARKGLEVERPAKPIEVFDLRMTEFAPPRIDFAIVCSKGTYIRTLVDDIGLALGCGATLRSLRRTRIGAYRVEDAFSINDLIALREALDRRKEPSYEVSESAS